MKLGYCLAVARLPQQKREISEFLCVCIGGPLVHTSRSTSRLCFFPFGVFCSMVNAPLML